LIGEGFGSPLLEFSVFVCQGCIKDKKQFAYAAFKSKGPCENCRYTDVCVDIPSFAVDIDPKWKANLYRDLTKAGLPEEAAKWAPKI